MTPDLLLLGFVLTPIGLASAFLWRLAKAPVISRMTALLGMGALPPLFLLGVVWPSPFTVASVAALPAFLFLLASLFVPRRVGQATRWMLSLSVVLSPLGCIAFAAWLEH